MDQLPDDYQKAIKTVLILPVVDKGTYLLKKNLSDEEHLPVLFTGVCQEHRLVNLKGFRILVRFSHFFNTGLIPL